MYGDRFVDPWHIEKIAPTQVLFSHAATIQASRADLIAQHLVQVPRLRGEPIVYESLGIGTIHVDEQARGD